MSRPSSPPLQNSPPRIHPLADIFADSPPLTTPFSTSHSLTTDHTSPALDHDSISPASENTSLDNTSDIASDMPRLRATHCTAGYRNGISAAKEQWLQPGFDEGYSLGAVLGLRVGSLLGVLEGLCAAAAAAAGAAGMGEGENNDEGERRRLRKLLKDARVELALQNVFAREWWGEDGTWKFPVRSKTAGGDTAGGEREERNHEEDGDGDEDEDEDEVTFVEVADQHPLLARWSHAISAEMQRVGLQENIFEGDEWESGRIPAK